MHSPKVFFSFEMSQISWLRGVDRLHIMVQTLGVGAIQMTPSIYLSLFCPGSGWSFAVDNAAENGFSE